MGSVPQVELKILQEIDLLKDELWALDRTIGRFDSTRGGSWREPRDNQGCWKVVRISPSGRRIEANTR